MKRTKEKESETRKNKSERLFVAIGFTYCFVYYACIFFNVYFSCLVFCLAPDLFSGSRKNDSGQMGTSVAIIGVVSVCIYMGVSMMSDHLFKKNQNWRSSRVFVVAGAMILGALFFSSIMVFQNPIWVIVAMCLAKGLTYAILPIGPTIMINEMQERGD